MDEGNCTDASSIKPVSSLLSHFENISCNDKSRSLNPPHSVSSSNDSSNLAESCKPQLRREFDLAKTIASKPRPPPPPSLRANDVQSVKDNVKTAGNLTVSSTNVQLKSPAKLETPRPPSSRASFDVKLHSSESEVLPKPENPPCKSGMVERRVLTHPALGSLKKSSTFSGRDSPINPFDEESYVEHDNVTPPFDDPDPPSILGRLSRDNDITCTKPTDIDTVMMAVPKTPAIPPPINRAGKPRVLIDARSGGDVTLKRISDSNLSEKHSTNFYNGGGHDYEDESSDESPSIGNQAKNWANNVLNKLSHRVTTSEATLRFIKSPRGLGIKIGDGEGNGNFEGNRGPVLPPRREPTIPEARVENQGTQLAPPLIRHHSAAFASGNSNWGTEDTDGGNGLTNIFAGSGQVSGGRPLSHNQIYSGYGGFERIFKGRGESDDVIPATTSTMGINDGQFNLNTDLSSNNYPVATEANRRPPVFSEYPCEINTKYDTKLFAICSDILCTTGFFTRLWNVFTGEMVASLRHDEPAKVTAVDFKSVNKIEDEGKYIWLGTQLGDILEFEVASQSIINTRSVQGKRPIIKIFRNRRYMWTINQDGKVNIWIPDESNSASLSLTPQTFNIPKGHTFSIMVEQRFWVATGKELRIFDHDCENNVTRQVLDRALIQVSAGDITSGAIIKRDKQCQIYFGHSDGKVSIYDGRDFLCLGLVSVSFYKISCLVSSGGYLWASYNTGKIYVYDTRKKPWKVMKDWQAHENSIPALVADKTSIWKMNRFQVVSLGTDNMVRFWDGMLLQDWLDHELETRQSEFCQLGHVTALVLTWNVGASKPSNLQLDEVDSQFFPDFFRPFKTYNPDIIKFGFQELVDLEDKKINAKSFFKSAKKRDTAEQETMSHQYRIWRDYLVKMVNYSFPNLYGLLHSSELVGLFSCVFIRNELYERVRHVDSAQVKLGMGGLHGNKGALITRFTLDDSSICFVNCHLAAGQSQTVHRNNDIASIIESSVLPAELDLELRSDLFVGGGNGSMISDHEICIVNGDMNYRIESMTRDSVINAVHKNELNKLLERDQLLLSRKRNPGFRLRTFTEAPITFAPTYKYDVGTDVYDTSDKKRSPAWCDRIMYRTCQKVEQLSYKRHEVRISDHRPVSAYFRFQIKDIDNQRKRTILMDNLSRLTVIERALRRDAKLDYLYDEFSMSPEESESLLS